MKAFPSTIENHANYGETGMELRDYFAAKAMQAIIAGNSDSDGLLEYSEKMVAICAYGMADEMMKARVK